MLWLDAFGTQLLPYALKLGTSVTNVNVDVKRETTQMCGLYKVDNYHFLK